MYNFIFPLNSELKIKVHQILKVPTLGSFFMFGILSRVGNTDFFCLKPTINPCQHFFFSDIDLVICGKWPQLPFGDLSDALQHLAKPGSLKVLERAAVPIIKLADDLTGIRVDVSFNMANGLRAVELVKHYKKCYPALPKLIYVLKQFLYQRDLNEVCIIWLFVAKFETTLHI